MADSAHSLNCFYRVVAGSTLTWEHYGWCLVKDCIRNIIDLCTGRAGIMSHALKHLGCYDYELTWLKALAYHILLYNRNLFKRNFNTHISSCYHDSVSNIDNCIKILNTLLALNLGNELGGIVMLLLKSADFKNILCTADEAECEEVKAGLHGKF